MTNERKVYHVPEGDKANYQYIKPLLAEGVNEFEVKKNSANHFRLSEIQKALALSPEEPQFKIEPYV